MIASARTYARVVDGAYPAARALDAFKIDGYTPFMDDPRCPNGLLTAAHGITQALAAAFSDSGALTAAGQESELETLNTKFIASALNGVGNLIAMALFLQEQHA